MKDIKPQTAKPSGAGKTGGLNSEIQSRIGHQLRAMYDDVVRQGVPDRFADLIKQLDASETNAATAGSGSANESNLAAKTDGRD